MGPWILRIRRIYADLFFDLLWMFFPACAGMGPWILRIRRIFADFIFDLFLICLPCLRRDGFLDFAD
jgi:hypothetical protein